MNKKYFIALFGRPCSGKTYVSNIIQHTLKNASVSMHVLKCSNAVFSACNNSINNNNNDYFVPQQMAKDIIKTAMEGKLDYPIESGNMVLQEIHKQFQSHDILVCDGFPRTSHQFALLYGYTLSKNIQVIFLHLDIEKELLHQRREKRRVCKLCKHTDQYDILNENTVCKKCKKTNALESRLDDKKEILDARIKLQDDFHNEITSTINNLYKNKTFFSFKYSANFEKDIIKFIKDLLK